MPNKLHIAAIVPYPIYPAKMGGQKGIALFYEYLSKMLPVTMIGTTKQLPQQFDGEFIPALGESKYRYINPALFLKVKRRIENAGASHLILEHPYFGWLGVMLKRACKLKLVIHSHNIESLRFKTMHKWWWKILWQYERITHRNADISFFITDEDRAYAIKQFDLIESKCHTITYGIEMAHAPTQEEKHSSRKVLEELYGIHPDENILLFNGTLSYVPNLLALDHILQNINPLLLKSMGYKYKILICGKGLPENYQDLTHYKSVNIIHAGFVEDISVYFKGADVFLNPTVDGGGIKTKLVEALGYNNAVVSYTSGAIGIPAGITGNKLQVIEDNDSMGFVSAILSVRKEELIPASFFNHFYWTNIVTKAALVLQQSLQTK